MHISKVTLHQVVNLYLHLCDNESIGEPEALYLSLSTRLTIPAAISDLAAAANEGKGLSEIFPWDDYEEIEPAKAPAEGQHHEPDQDVSASSQPQEQGPQESQEPHASHDPEQQEDQEAPAPSRSEAPQIEQPEAPLEHGTAEWKDHPGKEEHEVPVAAEEDAARSEDGHHKESQQGDLIETEQNADDQQGDYAHEDENIASGNRGDDVPPTAQHEGDEYEEYEEGEYGDESQEYNERELEGQEHAHPANDQSFESEEQNTESTATITPLPAQDAAETQQDADQFADAPQAEHDDDDDHDDYLKIEGLGTEEERNAETNPDAPEHAEYVADLEYDDNAADYAYDDAKPEENVDKTHGEPSFESREPVQNGGNEQDHASEQDATDEALQNDFKGILHEQYESKVEDGVPDVVKDNAQGTAELAGDLPGLAEDLKGNPAEDAEEVNDDHKEPDHGDSGEVWVETEDVPFGNAKDYVQDVAFGGDDDEYLNLDFDAEFGLPEESGISEAVAPNHASTKRTREPEDETELAETPTPDAKRSRPS